MGRPSKKELREREKKIDSGLYNRDSKYYIEIENCLEELNTHEKSYQFCLFCRERSGLGITRKSKEVHKWSFDETYETATVVPMATFFWVAVRNYGMSIKEFLKISDLCTYTSGLLNFRILEKHVSKELLRDIVELAEEDFTTEILPLIKPQRYNILQPYFTDSALSKKAYIEIDLSKSLEDITEVVTKIKESFDKDHTMVYNPYEALGYKIEPFTCNIKDCDIFKHKSPKTLGGKMTDLLYIYDSKKDGLHNPFIIEEITRYWKDIKKVSTEEFYHFDEYYKQAKDLIDDEKHQNYLYGVSIKPPL